MSGEPRKGPSGLRDVATLQTLTHRGQPRNRHQLVSRFARLENERARLEQELGMWATRRQATKDKLVKIYEQIDALRPLLLEEPTKVPVARQARGRARSRASTEVSGLSPPPSRTVSLDY